MRFLVMVLVLLSVPVLAKDNVQGKSAPSTSTPKKTPQATSSGEDWTLWGGKNRDFIVNTSGLADSWPAAGPKQLWTRPMGDGYSAISEEAGVLYTAYRRGSRDVITALDAATGKHVGNTNTKTRSRIHIPKRSVLAPTPCPRSWVTG